MNNKNDDYIEINGVKISFTYDEEKIAPGQIDMNPAPLGCRIEKDEKGNSYEINIKTEEEIIKMINDAPPNN